MAGQKKYVLLISFLLISFVCSKAEIKNGYSSQVKGMRESLKALNTLLSEDASLTVFQRASMKASVTKLIEYISYYELTEELLNQFQNIAPHLYTEIDTIKDYTGQDVSVYVKFVPEEEMQRGAAGTTNLNHLEDDINTYLSEYGPRTISIKIASVTKSLILLAHEFGHVKYQVKNLGTYLKYYSAHYQNGTFSAKYIGHNSNDPSGHSANEFENLFRLCYLNFLKTNNSKPENPFALLGEIRKKFTRM